MAKAEVSFDAIARPYRWMEYAALGMLLQRARVHFLAEMRGCRRAMVADAVDTSAAMLGLLAGRTDPARVTTHHGDALDYKPDGPVDLVATHFFLDCLTQGEVDALCSRLAGWLRPGGLWVVSDFRIPGGAMRWPARIYVGMLYRVFGVLTGMRVRRLPDFASALEAAGLRRVGVRHRLFGLLTSELWRLEARRSAGAGDSALQ